MIQTQTPNTLESLLARLARVDPDRIHPHPRCSGVYQVGALNVSSALSEPSLAFLERSLLKLIEQRGWSLSLDFDSEIGCWSVVISHQQGDDRGFEAADDPELAKALLSAYLDAVASVR